MREPHLNRIAYNQVNIGLRFGDNRETARRLHLRRPRHPGRENAGRAGARCRCCPWRRGCFPSGGDTPAPGRRTCRAASGARCRSFANSRRALAERRSDSAKARVMSSVTNTSGRISRKSRSRDQVTGGSALSLPVNMVLRSRASQKSSAVWPKRDDVGAQFARDLVHRAAAVAAAQVAAMLGLILEQAQRGRVAVVSPGNTAPAQVLAQRFDGAQELALFHGEGADREIDGRALLRAAAALRAGWRNPCRRIAPRPPGRHRESS